MTKPEMIQKIKQLRDDAGWGTDAAMVAMCDRALEDDCILRDSGDNVALSDEDLGCTIIEYVEHICASLDCPQLEGHVEVNGRKVYAA